MSITTKKKYTGQDKTDTLSGNLRIETGNNRLVIYNGTQELSVVDGKGFNFTNPDGSSIHIGVSATGVYGITYYDTAGNVMATSTGSRSIYYDSSNSRIVIGKSPDDGRIGIWVSKVGQNVITNLGG